jgi:hypothetical protein
MKSDLLSLIFAAVLGLGASLPAMAQPEEAPQPHACSTTPAQLQAEKNVVLDFYRPGITLRELIALIDPGYVQHNPLVLKAAAEKHISDYEEFKRLELVTEREVRRQGKYQPLFDAVVGASLAGKQEWVRVSGDEIAGKDSRAKQAAIWQAAYARKMAIETSVRNGFCYVRLVDPNLGAADSGGVA